MAHRAQVMLAGDPAGIHFRPAAQVGQAIGGFDAQIVFSRGDESCDIDTGLPALSVLAAAAVLGLSSGSTFELTCDGPEAEEAFDALRMALTQGYLAGSLFVVLR